MSLVERCFHQLADEGLHSVLFKEQWDACKKCEYNPEINKKCDGYYQVTYEIPDIKSESLIYKQIEKISETVISDNINFENIRA
jgi:hypothetical protein